jgi:hypothetical protein
VNVDGRLARVNRGGRPRVGEPVEQRVELCRRAGREAEPVDQVGDGRPGSGRRARAM